MSNDFIINTVTHKRWWLPDKKHQYNCVLYGDSFRITIIEQPSNAIVHSHTIKIDAEGKYKELLELSQELANRKYGRRFGMAEQKTNAWSGRLGSSLGKLS